MRQADVSRIAGDILTMLTEGGRHQLVLDRALKAIESWLLANQGFIKAKFSEASKYTPGLVDNYIVSKVMEGVISLLSEINRNPHHEIRRKFDESIHKEIHNLKTSHDYQRRGRILTRQVLNHFKREGYYGFIWRTIRKRISDDLVQDRSMVKQRMADALVLFARGLAADAPAQEKMQQWCLDLAQTAALRYRHEFSGLIADVVGSWNATEVSDKLEREIGRDLQFIRINGTLVGGGVGVVLHALIRIISG
jgi:uncharacterized membrane-anchored protein YjiN (DUF445 family)